MGFFNNVSKGFKKTTSGISKFGKNTKKGFNKFGKGVSNFGKGLGKTFEDTLGFVEGQIDNITGGLGGMLPMILIGGVAVVGGVVLFSVLRK